jgi:hypothetical protein
VGNNDHKHIDGASIRNKQSNHHSLFEYFKKFSLARWGCFECNSKLYYVICSVGRAMPQVISRRPLTAEARVNPCGICGGQSDTGTGFSPSSSVFPCQYIIPPLLSKLISSGECVICWNKGRHPRLGLTHPTFK